MTDSYGRKIEYMRVSVTSACSLSCVYCGGGKKDKNELSASQIVAACEAASLLGIRKLRFTGGEPLQRADLCEIISACSKIKGIEHIALTTNGVLLSDSLKSLIAAGLNSVNISLDTTDKKLYKKLTGFDNIQKVLTSIKEASQVLPVRLNCVPLLSYYEQQVCELANLSQNFGVTARFIELMPTGNKDIQRVDNDKIILLLNKLYGKESVNERQNKVGPARYFTFERYNGEIGFISPMTHSFCNECSRIRLMSNGIIRPCLASDFGVDILKASMQGEDLSSYFEKAIAQKPKRHNLISESLKPLSTIGG